MFRSDGSGAPDVFSMDAAGGTLVNLTESPAVRDLDPAWSPDGRHLAFTRTTHDDGQPDVYVANENGAARARLTRTGVPERDPAWSPDGTRIAFARTDRTAVPHLRGGCGRHRPRAADRARSGRCRPAPPGLPTGADRVRERSGRRLPEIS
jgi:Tol biopolymer transport system component